MKTDWDKITEDAFSSDEEHIFSDSYCRRRAELQGGITMEKKREKVKRRRFSASAAAAAAALVLIPAGTIGALYVTSDKNAEKTSGPAAAVTEESMNATLATEAAEGIENATYAIATGTVTEPVTDDEPLAVQEYGEKYSVVYYDYEISYDNVPSVFISSDGFKYHYNDGKDHAGGISPCGVSKYDDFYRFLSGAFDECSSDSVEDYTFEQEGMEWHVYINHRKAIDNDGDGVADSEWTNGWFDRDVIIKFGDTGYAAGLYVYDEITADDLRAFIQGMRLVKLDEPETIEFPVYGYPSYCAVDEVKVKETGEGGPDVEYYYIPDGYRPKNEYNSVPTS